jgi:hypothetical protein
MPSYVILRVIHLRLFTLLLKPSQMFLFPVFHLRCMLELGMLQSTRLLADTLISTQTLQPGIMSSVEATMSMTVSKSI